MSDQRLPASLRRRDDQECIREDLLPYLGSTVEERSAILSALCREAVDALRVSADAEKILAHQDRRSAESEALWLELIYRARRT